MADPVYDILVKAPVDNAVRAAAWNAFSDSANSDELASKLQDLKIPDSFKASLWNLKEASSVTAQPTATGYKDTVQEVSVPSGAVAMQGVAQAIPMAESLAKSALSAPNAPRIIQRAIGAGVRGVSTAAGAAVGGVPGAIGGAAISEGLTPTQQTIRGWLGRTATKAAESADPASDAVTNYIESMGANANNLTGASLEYAKKAGRAILYDASGKAALVPSEAAAVAPVATPVAKAISAAAPYVKAISMASGAQGVLDLAQLAEPKRKDIGFFGVGSGTPDPQHPALLNALFSKIADVVTSLKNEGIPHAEAQAMKLLSDGNAATFGKLMTLYMNGRAGK